MLHTVPLSVSKYEDSSVVWDVATKRFNAMHCKLVGIVPVGVEKESVKELLSKGCGVLSSRSVLRQQEALGAYDFVFTSCSDKSFKVVDGVVKHSSDKVFGRKVVVVSGDQLADFIYKTLGPNFRSRDLDFRIEEMLIGKGKDLRVGRYVYLGNSSVIIKYVKSSLDSLLG